MFSWKLFFGGSAAKNIYYKKIIKANAYLLHHQSLLATNSEKASRYGTASYSTNTNSGFSYGSKTGKNKNSVFTALAGIAAVGVFTVGGISYWNYLNNDFSLPQALAQLQHSDELREEEFLPYETAPEVTEYPSHAQYLLIGGGTASFSAFRAIKSRDPKAKVLIISEEASLPYMRPPLSKDLWFNSDKDVVQNLKFQQWNGKERSLFFQNAALYAEPSELADLENGGVSVIRGRKVVKLDVKDREAELDNGVKLTYEKCLIATGGVPKNLSVFENAPNEVKKKVTLFRKIDDFRRLFHLTERMNSVAVVGGGFLGSELACALGFKGQDKKMKVHQIISESGNLGAVLPRYLSEWTTDKIREEGVNVIPKSTIESVRMNDKQVELTLTGGDKIDVDHVVVAVGLDPNTQLAETSGLEVDPVQGGFLVNAELEARSNVWVAGDASCFYDTQLGRRRVEHYDHAVVSGRLAGENMTGAGKPYWHQSMFWSDLGEKLGFEAIGLIDSSLPTMAVFTKPEQVDSSEVSDSEYNRGTISEEQISSTKALNSTATQSPVEESMLQSESPRTTNSSPSSPSDDRKSQMTDDSKSLQVPLSSDELEHLTKNLSEVRSSYGFNKGVVFYLRDDTIVGILLWNLFNRIALARKVLKDGGKDQDKNEIAKLFEIYDSSDEDKVPE